MNANLERPESTLRGPVAPWSFWSLWSLWSSRTPYAPVRTNPNRFELQIGTSENRAVRPAAALFGKYATQTLDFRSMQPSFQFLISDLRFPIFDAQTLDFRSFQEFSGVKFLTRW